MRASFRLRREEEEEESVFISMTDMTVGFLFIVIILLAFFATQIAPGETVPKLLLDERDEQVALLQERLLIYRDLVADADEDVIVALQNRIHDLTDQNRALGEQLDNQQSTLAALRTELDAGPADDLRLKIRQLRSEIDRLHQLLRRSETENPIARYNTLAAEELAELLTRIQSRVRAIDDQIEVDISRNNDALQFRGDGLFLSGASSPSGTGRAKMQLIASILNEEIRCFTYNIEQGLNALCNPDAITIDAIQIEGHTDSVGEDIPNMELGARRGSSIYEVMISETNELLEFRNIQGMPILSVAGYGEGRPISDEALPSGKDANRRIDIRFIMYAPVNEATIPLNVDDLERVRELIGAGAAE